MKSKVFICLLIVSQVLGSSINLNTAEQVALELLNRRQIENKSFEKLQKHMLLLAKSKNLLTAN